MIQPNLSPLHDVPDILMGRRGVAAFVYIDNTWYVSACSVKDETPMSAESIVIAKAAAFEDLVRKIKSHGLDHEPAREYCALYTIYEVNE